jgi:hypothetical protein
MWMFKDPPNVAVIANRKIVTAEDWIAGVSHDLDDGGWQFQSNSAISADADDAVVVSLRTIVELDETISELADLPLGWHAWRESKSSAWKRAKAV